MTLREPAEGGLHSAVEAADLLFNAKRGRVERPYLEPRTRSEARAAVERFGELFAQLPGAISDALDAASQAGDLLSGDRLQGLSEIVQNADDVHATEVRFALTDGALVAAHDGDPVTLRNVLALATPWLTTKASESLPTGRFGIGLMTLRALGSTLEVHCEPYHVRLGDPTVQAIEPRNFSEGVGGSGWTFLRVPLESEPVREEDLTVWLGAWDDLALLFLRDVRQVGRVDSSGDVVQRLQLSWRGLGSLQAAVDGHDVQVDRRQCQGTDGRRWVVYSAEPPSPPHVRRTRKAAGKTTPMGVALPLQPADGGVIYAGLPITSKPVPVRINAQFDPLASRQGIGPTNWSKALVPLVADLWSASLLDLYERNPRAAWRTVPLESLSTGDPPTGSPVALLEQSLLDRARHEVASNLTFQVGEHGAFAISQLAVEEVRLEGVVTPAEVAAVAGLPSALPADVRDRHGRWRDVLDDWREYGVGLPDVVLVEDALTLLDDPGRAPESIVAIVAAAVEADLGEALGGLPCVVTADGRHVAPPTSDDELIVVAEPTPLAEELGIAVRLHTAFLENNRDARTVLEWLRKRGALLATSDGPAVVRRLAAMGESGHALSHPLTDAQARSLRDVFEGLPANERAALGPNVGAAVHLHGYTYDRRGRKQDCTVRPADGYLPKSIDREPDGFAEAAANTVGLQWIAGRYMDALRSPTGRGGVGALRLLRLLGAETAPRVRSHPLEVRRFIDPRMGVPAAVSGGPELRRASLERLEATFTLRDHDSPDLEAVVGSIAAERSAKRRRTRAAALLGALARAWSDRLGDLAVVTAAHDYVQWNVRGEMRAFWLWKAGDVAWLDDTEGVPRRPVDLRLRTQATVALYGADIPGYLRPEFDAPNRRPVLDALGVTGEPTTPELIQRLEDLRRAAPDDGTATDAAVVYQALAERISQGGRGPGHMSTERIRGAFSRRPGLVLTPEGWHTPAQVLRGAPIFGRWRSFVPPVPHTDALWSALKVPVPSVKDSLDVLGQMARSRKEPDAADQVVMLETLRRLAVLLPKTGADADLARRLARTSLWTSFGWRSARPVYAVDDPVLADRLGASIAVWNPGGGVQQFRGLLEPLRIVELSPADTEVIDPDHAEEDGDLSDLFRSAVQLLREDLARNEPVAAQSTSIPWDDIGRMKAAVHDRLHVRIAGLHGTALPDGVEVDAKADSRRGVIYVRDRTLLPRAEAGGRAVASLFTSDRRRVAQAWRTAWDGAEAGKHAREVVLAREQADKLAAVTEAEIEARTAAVRNQIRSRQQRGSTEARRTGKPLPPKPPGGDTGSGTAGPTRSLVDPNALRLRDAKGRVVGTLGGGQGSTIGGTKPTKKQLVPPRRGTAGPRSHAAAPGYTPVSRETIGLDLVRRVLGGDADEIEDLRAQHGVGADALDELDQFYELKVFAGTEPDRVTLTDSEVQRALTEPGFFLVVVSEVEGKNAHPKVRIIADPLKQLRPTDTGTLTLTGVREAFSLLFEFEQETTDDAPPTTAEDSAEL